MWLLRQVAGRSMCPALRPGQIVLLRTKTRRLHVGAVVVLRHEGRDKIKRIVNLKDHTVYVAGDNGEHSTDSRHFGWVDKRSIMGVLLWPRI